MPRYIDADKLIDMANHEGAYGYVDVYDICSIPEADVAEIVPCRKCKFYKRTGTFYGLCKHRQWNETISPMVLSHDFCSYAKAKEKSND